MGTSKAHSQGALEMVVREASAPSARGAVVRIIARMNVGGPAFHTMHLTQGLRQRYPTLLVVGDVDEGEADMRDRAEERGLPVYRLPELGRTLRPWQDLAVLVKLVRLLRRVRPQVVHTHTAKAGTLGRIAALVAGVPVRVHTFHGHVFHGYFGRLATQAFLWIERALARTSTCIVAISASQANDLCERYRICPREKLRVVPLGLELDRFAPARTAGLREEFRREIDAGERPVISIVGRLAPIKNHDLFLSAAAALRAAGRECRFVVVGGGTESDRLQARAQELGLGDSVVFLGWRSDLERIYAGSDIVALTSRNEGTPVCLIEALSAGRAVVSTDVGGVRDVLENGRLGVLVPSDDVGALAAALQRLIDAPALAEELGRRGAEVIPQRFGVERLLRDVGDLYEELLADRSERATSSIPQPA